MRDVTLFIVFIVFIAKSQYNRVCNFIWFYAVYATVYTFNLQFLTIFFSGNIRVTNLSLHFYGTAASSIPGGYQDHNFECSLNDKGTTKTTGSKSLTTRSPKNEDVKDVENSTYIDIDAILAYLPLTFSVLFMIILALWTVIFY